MRIVPADFEFGSMDDQASIESQLRDYADFGIGSNGEAAHTQVTSEDVNLQLESTDSLSQEPRIAGSQVAAVQVDVGGRQRQLEGEELTVRLPTSQGSVSRSMTSSQEDLAESDLEALEGPQLTRVGSVQISEWNLEHMLKLREDDEADCEQERQTMGHVEDGQETVFLGQAGSIRSAESLIAGSDGLNAGLPPSSEGVGGPLNRSSFEDTLRMLNFDAPPPPTQSERKERSSVGRVDWWAEALAETQNVTDNFDSLDALVEANASKNTGSPETASPQLIPVERHSTAVQGILPGFTLEPGMQLSGTKEEEEKGTVGVPSSVCFSDVVRNLKPARSEGSLSDSHGNVGEFEPPSQPVLHSAAQGDLTTATTSEVEGSLADMTDTKFLGSHGKGRAKGSRSPSPASRSKRQGSPLTGSANAYILQAGRLIKKGLEYESSGEYQEAFDLFKAGVDLLLNGVQSKL